MTRLLPNGDIETHLGGPYAAASHYAGPEGLHRISPDDPIYPFATGQLPKEDYDRAWELIEAARAKKDKAAS